MIEVIVREYLLEELDEPVYLEVPADPPKRYVVLEKVGGSCTNHIDAAMMAIRSVAESLYEAAALNRRVIAAMDGIVRLDAVSNSELNSDYNNTSTASKEYRYQAVFDLIY